MSDNQEDTKQEQKPNSNNNNQPANRETHDNKQPSKQPSNRPLSSKGALSCNVGAIQQQLAISQQLAAATPLRQSRPLRPNLRRQLVVQAGDSGVTPIELAGVIGPPKRPANLPARYDTFGRAGNPAGVPAGAGNAPVKPNRYSWAQMQQWQAANQAQAAAAAAALSSQHAQHPHPEHGFHHHFSSPFSSAASRVLVVNPMQIVNLSEHTKSRLIKFIESTKRFSEQWFSHVLLLLFLAVYACFGAYVFISFEAPSEQWEKQLIIDTRFKIVNDSYDVAKEKDRDEFVDLFRRKFEDYERLLNKACQSGMTSSSLENQWNFWGALFYSMTVFTTIGYGHLTPITFAGRVATMIYAIFGIPILLMVLADLGKLLTRIIKYAFKKFRYLFNKLLRRKSSLRTRKLISDNTNQYIGVARDAFERGFSNYIQPQYNRIPQAFRSGSPRRRTILKRWRKEQKRQSDATDEQQVIDQSIDQLPVGSNKSQDEPSMSERKSSKDSSSNLNQTTDVIITPAKQTKPVSPQPTNDKRSPLDAHHHHHNHRGQSPAKRKISSPNLSAGKKNSQTSNKNSVSRSSSSSALTNDNKSKSTKSIGERRTSQEKQLEQQNVDKLQKQEQPSTQTNYIEQAGPEKALSEAPTQIDTLNDQLEAPEVSQPAEAYTGDEEYEEEDDFDIPVSFALFLLVTYMMFGAVIFSIWEGWNFFDSLYFVFISMSTIGFGDLVPQHPKRMIGTFIYLLFGLALTSMCINVVQEKIHATFLRAKMQIGEKMGLDLEQIMADDYYDGSLGMEGDEDEDGNSVAVSQTNSSSAQQFGPDGEILEPFESHTHRLAANKAFSIDNTDRGDGLRHSKSRDSFKASTRRRQVTGLPGHNNNSLRRKSAKRTVRQLTPQQSSHHGDHSTTNNQQQVPLSLQVISPSVPTTPTTPSTPPPASSDLSPLQQLPQQQPQPQQLKPEVDVVKRSDQLMLVDPAPSINQPVNENIKGTCEPLKNFKASSFIANHVERPGEQVGPKWRPTVAKSLSSDVSSRLNNSNSNSEGEQCSTSGGAHSTSGNRRTSTTSRQNHHARPHGRSADSSRRSSVSQELNQLDDLIIALSKSPAAEKFGPLLGIPASARTSRSNSPSTLNARRGTSMTTRPSQSTLPSPTVKKKISMIVTPMRSPTSSEVSQAALDELESLRFSAV